MLADAGCNGDPIATRSTCLKYLLLNVKNDFLVAVLIKLLKLCLEILVGFSLPLYNLSKQISMGWSRGVAVKCSFVITQLIRRKIKDHPLRIMTITRIILWGNLKRFCNFHFCTLSWCKMGLSLTTRNKLILNSSLTLCVSFSKV